MKKVKYFFLDIFNNGNNTQKTLLFLFVFNLIFSPLLLSHYHFLKPSRSCHDPGYLYRIDGMCQGLGWSEFMCYIFMSFFLIFSIILFKSKKN